MVELKTSREITLLRQAGRVVAEALSAVRERAEVGVTLTELDRVAATSIEEAGATPAFLHYQPSSAPTPYPGVICASVNDAVVHGIPTRARLADGDLVSIDCGAFLAGWCGDAAISFTVGTPHPDDRALIAATDAVSTFALFPSRPFTEFPVGLRPAVLVDGGSFGGGSRSEDGGDLGREVVGGGASEARGDGDCVRAAAEADLPDSASRASLGGERAVVDFDEDGLGAGITLRSGSARR
jgi:hypothetical protein